MFENVSKIARKDYRAKLDEQREAGKVVRLWASRRHVTKGAFDFARKTGTRIRTLEEIRSIEEGSATFSDEAYHRITLADLEPLPDGIEVQLAEDEYFGWNPEEEAA